MPETTCQIGSTQHQTQLVVGSRGQYPVTVPLAECETTEQINPWIRVIRYGSIIGAVCSTLHGRAAFDGDDFEGDIRVSIASGSIPLGKDRDNGAIGEIVPVEGGYGVHWKLRDDSGRLHEDTVGCFPTVCAVMAENYGQGWLEPSIYMDAFGK